MLRALLTLLIGAMLIFSVPTGSEAGCSFNCPKAPKEWNFYLSAPDNFSFGTMKNWLHLPKANAEKVGAVIILHSCGGIRSKNSHDLARWGKLLLENNYAVLVIDHLGPRDIKDNCGRGRRLGSTGLKKDVYKALKFLNDQSSIDKSRIFTLGFSLGAMTSGALASPDKYTAENKFPRLRAVAGLYGGCYTGESWLGPSGDIPVLWLVGGQDTESPPNSCGGAVSALKDKGLMTFHLYPNATHCWDCAALDGFGKSAGNGSFTVYKYDAEATKDSEQRVLNFFNSFQSQ
jgi:dienelactone hydrolase